MIRYDRNGRIFTSSKDKEMEHDINEVLHLNGIVDKATGNMVDTSTCLVKGRKDVYDSFCRFIEGLSKKNKLSSIEYFFEANLYFLGTPYFLYSAMSLNNSGWE